MFRNILLFGYLVFFFTPTLSFTQELPEKTIEALTAQARKSVVVINVADREGKKTGLGSGFVIGKGLIATNLHVVGQARPIHIETADGKKHDVLAIHASDRKNDLAIVQIKDESLPILALGDASKVREGQSVVALGNPQGLKLSVVAGVISGIRDIDGRSMLQIAIPVERGNSGGPLLDRQGRVLGIITMKSLVTENLGFAVSIHALKKLLQKPNPVQMSAWLTIGAIDKDEWQPKLGSRWSQRAGRILVEGYGSGFGGRSFCLSNREVPKLPYEIAVSVKLDNEAGAAGLIFHADDRDRHYGFYPSGGGLRLTRFDGPNVFTWKILAQISTKHYKPGEWNRLRVRLEKDRILCFVNNHQVIESRDDVYTTGQVGLAKFRDTQATFKQFRIGNSLARKPIEETTKSRIQQLLTKARSSKVVEQLSKEGEASLQLLRDRTRKLEQEIQQLKDLAQEVKQTQILNLLKESLKVNEDKIDLIYASLLIAKLDNEEIDAQAYQRQMDRQAEKLNKRIPNNATDAQKRIILNEYFYKERGFHGSRADYYHRSNSYLNEVLDDREGLPITLAIVYMELGRRIGLKMEGVGLPGHFVVRQIPKKGKAQLIDVFEDGKLLSRKDAAKKVEEITGRPFQESHLATVSKRDILVRMLHNLLNVVEQSEDFESMHRYLTAIIALSPEAIGERGMRAAVRYRLSKFRGALEDIDWLLEKRPDGLNLNQVRSFRERVERAIGQRTE